MSVSELYDSTYVGNPHDMISQPPGYAFSRGGPIQRTSITHVLVCKPKMQSPSLDEFLEIEENDLNGPYNVDGQRPFVSGHNRYKIINKITFNFTTQTNTHLGKLEAIRSVH